MEYQKIINLLDDTTNQPSKCRAKNWVEVNNESKGRYDNSNVHKKIKLCDYSDAYIIVKGYITASNTTTVIKKVIFKNCIPFTDCITEISNTQVNDAQKIVLIMYNLIEYSDTWHKEVLGNTIEMSQF